MKVNALIPLSVGGTVCRLQHRFGSARGSSYPWGEMMPMIRLN